MKKILVLLSTFFIISLFYLHSNIQAEDRTYGIERVDIHVDVADDGVMHVTELSTFTFDGKFNGTERSIMNDVSDFKAYEVANDTHNSTISTEGLESLKIKNEDDLYRIHISAEDEQKTVLYTYDIKDEIKKYADVADMVYDFYPTSNNVDLGTLTITWQFENGVDADIHAYLYGDEEGTIELSESEVIYQHDQFESGMSAEVRIMFPATAVSSLPVKKDKLMLDKIIQDEQMKFDKKEAYGDRLASFQLLAIIFLIVLIVGMIWWFIIHPNRYRFEHRDDRKKHLTYLEETDPLFVSYMQGHGYVSNMQTALISGLLSLKRRGIISMKEVPSKKSEETMTYAFYWEKDKEGIDEVDAYLHTWLFTEEEGKEEFLLESIIFDEEEDESIQEEKQEHFTSHYDEWIKLVKIRKAFSGWYKPYQPFKYVSVLLTIVTFALFYYIISITPISSLTFQWVIGVMVVFTVMSLIWNRNKWILSVYYLLLIIVLLIVSMWSVKLLPFVGIMFVAWLGLLFISERKWNPEVARLVRLNQIATKLFKRKKYPVDDDETINERRLELAITLGKSKEYAEQIGKELAVHKVGGVHTPLLNNPNFAGMVFQPSNLIFYTAMASDSSSSTSMSSSSTGGSGGAGAF